MATIKTLAHSQEQALQGIRTLVDALKAEHEELTKEIQSKEEQNKSLKKDLEYWSEILMARSGQVVPTARQKRKNRKFVGAFVQDVLEFANNKGRFFRLDCFVDWYSHKHDGKINKDTARTNVMKCVQQGTLLSAKYNNNKRNTFYGLPIWTHGENHTKRYISGHEPDGVDMLRIPEEDKSPEDIVWSQAKKEVLTAA